MTKPETQERGFPSCSDTTDLNSWLPLFLDSSEAKAVLKR
jgi:hypothetical protein